ncbi:MAG TPA: hypothetical protein VGV93_10395 [Acidimicrobiales bacterium]|nr:hypothetical protein [Acidimicrobiales bacterium]
MRTTCARLRLSALLASAVLAVGCSDGSSSSSPTTSLTSSPSVASSTTIDIRSTTSTTPPAPKDPRFLTAADLGGDFQNRPYHPDDRGYGPCQLAPPDEPLPVERVGAAFASNTALQDASVEHLVYADAAAASVAFSAAQGGSACPGEENLDEKGRTPHPTHIAGADEAFSIGFVNPNDANGVTVARAGKTLVVAYSRFHFGAATSDGVTLQDLATRAVDRLR